MVAEGLASLLTMIVGGSLIVAFAIMIVVRLIPILLLLCRYRQLERLGTR
jgi:hypothetical protein